MSLYDITVYDVDMNEVSLSRFKDKVLLIVNTASKCGYTVQYKDLQTLYTELGNDDFEVLAFPCNQFGHQEPGLNEEIKAFCSLNYQVSFPLFAKIEVNGRYTHLLYKYLKESKLGFYNDPIQWNFTKFLVDKNGFVISRFAPSVNPMDLKERILTLMV